MSHIPRPSVRDLIALEDREFIDAACVALLGRLPQPSEGRLQELREGARKTSILRALRNSAEGRAFGSRVPGFRLYAAMDAVREIPVAGFLIALLFDLLNFSGFAQQIVATRRLLEQNARETHAQVSALNEALARIEAAQCRAIQAEALASIENRIADMTAELACLLDVRHQRLQAQIRELRDPAPDTGKSVE